ncbi:MAG TPA: hypothetical protein VKW06_17235 [Candidatus Angelobacter sp.]|nr:hypothetical protein [Candidatus Angelobacter sp.]
MKCLAATIFLFISASLFAQNAGIQTVSITSHTRPGIVANSADTSRPDLEVLLTHLERMTAATRYDLSTLQVEKWKSGWQTAWLKRGSQKQEAKELADSLSSNLRDAVPGLISEAQDSHGSVSSTFKLYNDLSAVVESVNSLSEMAGLFGKKSEADSLHSDYATLGQIRQELASYIQVSADLLEPLDKTPRPGTSTFGNVLSASARSGHRPSSR